MTGPGIDELLICSSLEVSHFHMNKHSRSIYDLFILYEFVDFEIYCWI